MFTLVFIYCFGKEIQLIHILRSRLLHRVNNPRKTWSHTHSLQLVALQFPRRDKSPAWPWPSLDRHHVHLLVSRKTRPAPQCQRPWAGRCFFGQQVVCKCKSPACRSSSKLHQIGHSLHLKFSETCYKMSNPYTVLPLLLPHRVCFHAGPEVFLHPRAVQPGLQQSSFAGLQASLRRVSGSTAHPPSVGLAK